MKIENQKPVLVIGGNGKTGRRVVARLQSAGRPVVSASRSGAVRFDWNDRTTWQDALSGVGAVYMTYQPDLAVPGAVDTVRQFVDLALFNGVRRLILLSGRGEEEAQRAELMLMKSGADWTIVRAAWFAQNFSENFMVDGVLAGTVVLPESKAREPFIDIDDIADVVVAALSDDRHIGQLYEVTGPRLMSFAEAVSEIAAASGRKIDFVEVPAEAYAEALAHEGVPEDLVWLINYLFTTVLDGRNEYTTDGVELALGRVPHDFTDYARRVADTGAWAA